MADAKKVIRRIEVEPGEPHDGTFHGATAVHHFKDAPVHSAKSGMGSRYVEPESRVFGASEGHELLAHLANHLHIPAGESAEEDEEK